MAQPPIIPGPIITIEPNAPPPTVGLANMFNAVKNSFGVIFGMVKNLVQAVPAMISQHSLAPAAAAFTGITLSMLAPAFITLGIIAAGFCLLGLRKHMQNKMMEAAQLQAAMNPEAPEGAVNNQGRMAQVMQRPAQTPIPSATPGMMGAGTQPSVVGHY